MDGFTGFGSGNGSGRKFGGFRKRRRESAPKEIDQSTLGWLGGKTTEGLAALANILSVPQAMAFNAIEGIARPEKKRSIFTPLLNPTSSEGRATGRDMLEVFTGAKNNDKRWDWTDPASLAIDVLADPLLLTGAGLLSKTGKAKEILKGGGELSRGLGTQLLKGERSLATLRPAFTGKQYDLGLGALGKKTAPAVAKIADDLGRRVSQSFPGRALNQYFNPRAMGRSSWAMQQASSMGYNAARKMQDEAGQEALHLAAMQKRLLPDVSEVDLRHMAEMRHDPAYVQNYYRQATGKDITPQEVFMFNAQMEKMAGRELAKSQASGLKSGLLEDPAGLSWVPRYDPAPISASASRAPLTASGTRQDFLKGWQGGTKQVQQMAVDTEIADIVNTARQGGASDKEAFALAGEALVQKYGAPAERAYQAGEEVRDRAADFVKWAVGLPDDVKSEGVFRNAVVADVADTSRGLARKRSQMDILAQNLPRVGAEAPGQVYDEASRYTLGRLLNEAGADPSLLASLGEDASRGLRYDVYEDAMRSLAGEPSATRSVLGDLSGKYNALFKAFALSRPARIVRDLMSGQVENTMTGAVPLGETGRSLGAAKKMLFGQNVPDAGQIPAVKDYLSQNIPTSLNPEEAATDALRILFSSRLGNSTSFRDLPTTGLAAPKTSADVLEPLTNFEGLTPAQFGKKAARTFVGREADTTLNPFDVRGVRTENTKFGPVKSAEMLGEASDYLNRASPFTRMLREGAQPGGAANIVRNVQVDYNPMAFTPFERQYLKPFFPFYSFSRQKVPDAMTRILGDPGGPHAQVIRNLGRASGTEDAATTPQYVSETTSIPMGTLNDGSKRYLTGLGLMHEAAIPYMPGAGGNIGLELLSQMAPLPKAFIEGAFGQSTFQRDPTGGGRNLEDMDPLVGRLAANLGQLTGLRKSDEAVKLPGALEHAVANSPLSPLLTMARQATDLRKYDPSQNALPGLPVLMNLLTGAKISDISPAAQDAVLRERLAQAQKQLGSRNYVTAYFPKDIKEAAPEKTKQMIQELEQISKILRARQKDRAKSKAALAK